MFELSKEFDVTVITDIGLDKRSAIIVDNFYQNPDEVRQYAYQCSLKNNPDLMSGLPGWRIYEENSAVRENLKPFFDELKEQKIWKNKINLDVWEENWNKTNFLCNVMNSETRAFGGGIPHHDGFGVHFGSVIYLNTPDECSGGTRLYSVYGNSGHDGEKEFGHLYNEHIKNKWIHDNESDDWKVEIDFEMVYNRCILYESDQLHAQWYEEGEFSEHHRLAQVLFI